MTAGTATPERLASDQPSPSLGLVIAASSAGTLIEWYDFYLYASIGAYLGGLFFAQGAHQGMLGLLFSMATLGIGFAIRPFGGLAFGSLGDRVGRKYSFLFTLLLMGLATTCMGLLRSRRSSAIIMARNRPPMSCSPRARTLSGCCWRCSGQPRVKVRWA